MEPLRLLETATAPARHQRAGWRCGIRFAGKDHPTIALAMLHGVLAAAAVAAPLGRGLRRSCRHWRTMASSFC
jgi:hypothetical protein